MARNNVLKKVKISWSQACDLEDFITSVVQDRLDCEQSVCYYLRDLGVDPKLISVVDQRVSDLADYLAQVNHGDAPLEEHRCLVDEVDSLHRALGRWFKVAAKPGSRSRKPFAWRIG